MAAVRHQLPFAGQMREALAELVEAAGDDDRRQAAKHHHRQYPAQDHALLHMHQRGITH